MMQPQRVVLCATSAAALVCGVAALAWVADLSFLARLDLLDPPAQPLTILLVLGTAIALGLTRLRPRWPAIATSLAVCAGAAGVMQNYIPEPIPGWLPNYQPEVRLPSPHSASATILLGCAIALVATRRRTCLRVGHALALVALGLMTLVILGYFFDATELYTLSPGVGISPLTAFALLLISIGTLSASPRFTVVRVFYLGGEGGRMARRFVPFVFSVPVLVAAAIASGLRHEWFSAQAGLALLAACVIALLGGIMWRYALNVSLSEARLDNLVRSRTRRLTETIAELEEFSQALAHDVRGPLINLREFLTIIRDDHAALLPRQGRDYLDRAIRASERVDRLTSAMLRYGEISRRPVQPATVDVEALVVAVAEELRRTVCTTASIRIEGALPSVWADPESLADVLRELLRNACQFARAEETPRITIRSEATTTAVRIDVRDEGIGVPPPFQERIFRPFEQLARVHEHIGIGLALVRRAITKMGGRVGVVSDGRHGSTFWVELPRQRSTKPL